MEGDRDVVRGGVVCDVVSRCRADVADAVDIELQILATERENITSLLCTKGRRARGIRKDWRRARTNNQN